MADQPEFRQQGTDLPKGSSTQLDEALDVAAAAPQSPALVDNSIDESEIPEYTGEQPTDEVDDEIFSSPSLFPGRPLTHGVPVGPGQNFAVTPRMSDQAILARAATRIIENKDNVPSGATLFALRVLAGE